MLAATCVFQQCAILTSIDSDEPVKPPLSLETPNNVQSVALFSLNIQATSKGSDQTARMRRLIWAFVGRTYHIVRHIMLRLMNLSRQQNLVKMPPH